MLGNFNFSLLDTPEFKEDSVREDIVCPLLNFLGYSSSGPNKITRSKNLEHPFVHIGTKKHGINIIPDYVLETSNGQKWILDAKSPKEEIVKSKNVEQAFSYAIHPNVRASIYALCNGRALSIFHISKVAPLLVIPSSDFSARAEDIKQHLSPLAFINPAQLNFRPDFGLYMTKLGYTSSVTQYFYSIGLPSIAKINENLYTACLDVQSDNNWYALSLDFDKKCYLQLLTVIPKNVSAAIQKALYSQPFKIDLTDDTPIVDVEARLADAVIANKNEDYCPLFVQSFKRP